MSAFAELDSTHVDAADGLLGEDLGIGTDDFGEEAADGAVEKEGGARGFANAMSQILSKTIPKARSKVRHSAVSELCVCVAGGRGIYVAAARVRNSTYIREWRVPRNCTDGWRGALRYTVELGSYGAVLCWALGGGSTRMRGQWGEARSRGGKRPSAYWKVPGRDQTVVLPSGARDNDCPLPPKIGIQERILQTPIASMGSLSFNAILHSTYLLFTCSLLPSTHT